KIGNRDLAVFDLEHADREIRHGALRLGMVRALAGVSEARIIPDVRLVLNQVDLRRIDGEAVDQDLLVEEQGADFDADVNLLRLNEGLLAEGGIVCNAELVCGKRAGEERKTEMAKRYFAAGRIGERALNARTVVVRIE